MKLRLRIVFLILGIGAMLGEGWFRVRDHAAAPVAALRPDGEALAHRPWFLAAVLLWALLGVYWEIEAKDATTARRSESSLSRGLHVFLANAAMILIMAPIQGLGRLWPVSVPMMAGGLAWEALGVGLAFRARRALEANWSGGISFKEDHQLVRHGPYKLLRHPICTGFLIMSFGAALEANGSRCRG